jgi:hypothetical protein
MRYDTASGGTWMLNISTCKDKTTVSRNVRIRLPCGRGAHPKRTVSSGMPLSKSRDQQRGHRPLLHDISEQSGSFVDAKHLVVEVTETRSANCRRVMNLEGSCISSESRMRRYEGFLNHDSQSHAIT